MLDAFDAWNRMLAVGCSMTRTGMCVAETMGAANDVVAARSVLIGRAARSPLAGEMQHLGDLAMRGRAPTAAEFAMLGDRMARVGLESVEAAARLGSATIAPVHRKATANARRLGRKAKR